MTSPRRVLAALVARYDERGSPLSPAVIATALDGDPDPCAVERCLDRLAGCELVAAEPDGYRPTVTGREFLDLDIDGGFAVVDPGAGSDPG
jgi:predicted transcriptional regulator